jgi:4-amino-4-deoxy-L-arabinose transferase-like glycosyltransferase
MEVRPRAIRSQTTPVTVAWLVVALAWLSAGMFDREPWKADEAYSFGIVYSMIEHGSWVVPTLAGEPFLEKPPLVFWLAALTAKAFASVMPLHAGARIANILLALVTFGFTWRASNLGQGRRPGRDAVLLLAGCPAWLIASRYLTADLGLVAAAAIVAYALAGLHRQRSSAGIWLGIGSAAGLLSKGLLFPGVVGLTMVALIATVPAFRNRYAAREYALAAIISAALALAWPIALANASPELLHTWLWDNNIGRFLGLNGLGPGNNRLLLLGEILLFLLPVLPLAIASLIVNRRGLRDSALYPPAMFCAAWIAVVALSSTARIVYILPVLPPLAVVAAGCIGRAPARLRADRLVMLAVALLIAAPIVIKLILFSRNADSRWSNAASVSSAELALAVAVAAALLVLLRHGLALRPAAFWAGGVTFAWALTLALYLRPADQVTGFKALFIELGRAMPAGATCIASRALGESERGLLEYYAGIRTLRDEVDPQAMARCPLRIEQERADDRARLGCGAHTEVWSGSRPDDPNNLFRLCASPGSAPTPAR